MTGRELYKAIGMVDEKYLDLVDAPEAEPETITERKHIPIKRTLTYLLAAAIAVSLLMGTAAAAGWLPGLFDLLKEQYPEDKELFEAAAQANADATPEFREIAQLDLSKFVLMERYFDGDNILIGYNLEALLPEPVVGVAVDETLLKEIKKGTRCSRIAWETSQLWFEEPATPNAIRYDLTEDAFTMDRMLKGTLTDTEYDKAWDLMEKNGYVCIAVQDVWVADHVLVNGIDTMENYLADGISYSNRTDYTTEQGYCIRLAPLPEDVRKMDMVTVTVNVRSSVEYWYMDMNGEGRVYHDGDSVESTPISFDLERSDAHG